MRIALVGNCQVEPLAHQLRHMIPGASVDAVFVARYTAGQLTEIAAAIDGYDRVFTHPVALPDHPLRTPLLREKVKDLDVFPPIIFTGFHPDCVAVPGHRSATGNFHSAIVIESYLVGLPPRRTVKLFNAYVYGLLDYFGAYEASRAHLLASARALGYSLERELAEWERLGVFMHNINHPVAEVLVDLARAMASRAGFAASEPAPACDTFKAEGAIWPVYPEIAARLRVESEFVFRQPGVALDLDHFVAECNRLYEAVPRGLLESSVTRHGEKLRRAVVKPGTLCTGS